MPRSPHAFILDSRIVDAQAGERPDPEAVLGVNPLTVGVAFIVHDTVGPAKDLLFKSAVGSGRQALDAVVRAHPDASATIRKRTVDGDVWGRRDAVVRGRLQVERVIRVELQESIQVGATRSSVRPSNLKPSQWPKARQNRRPLESRRARPEP